MATRDKEKGAHLGGVPCALYSGLRMFFFARKIALMEHSVTVSSCFLQLSAWQRRWGE